MSFGVELGRAIVQEFNKEFRLNNKLDDISEEVYDIVSKEFINDKALLNDFLDFYYGNKDIYTESTFDKGTEIVKEALKSLGYVLTSSGKWSRDY